MVVVKADDVTRRGEARDRAAARAGRRESELFKQPVTIDVSPDRTVAQLDIPMAGNGTDSQSNAALRELRDKLIPATIGQGARDERRRGGLHGRARRTSTTR